MEVIQTVFDQLQADISQRIKVLEKQVIFILSQNGSTAGVPPEEFLKIRRSMDEIQNRLGRMETRLQVVEVGQTKVPERRDMATQTTPSLGNLSGGLEGLLMKSISLPSPALTARSENAVVLPIVQRQVVLQEEEAADLAEPDEDAIRGIIAEQVGGLVEEEEGEQEEEIVEEVVEEVVEEDEEEIAEEEEQEEEEEVEEVELEEFAWKGKTYYKTPEHLLYRTNAEGDIEDDPFARYDPATNTVKKI